jgi:hypothetical protein
MLQSVAVTVTAPDADVDAVKSSSATVVLAMAVVAVVIEEVAATLYQGATSSESIAAVHPSRLQPMLTPSTFNCRYLRPLWPAWLHGG